MIALIICLIALTLAAGRQYRILMQSAERAEIYLEERAQFLDMFANASLGEATQRNFLITRDPEVLQYYEIARTQFIKNIDAILAIPDERLETTSIVKRVARGFLASLENTDRSVELGLEGRWDEAIALVDVDMRRQTGRGLLKIRVDYSDMMQQRTNALLSAQYRAQRLFSLFTGILGGVAISLGLILAWIGRSNILRLRRSERLSQEAEAARKRAEGERQRSEIMMREMNHRVGNSLGMVMSLLGVQRSRSDNDDVKTALQSAQTRILSVANAHRRLRFGGDMRSVELAYVLAGVADDIRQAKSRDTISIETHIRSLNLLDRDAVSIALLMNELVTNALKHSFADRVEGVIRVSTPLSDNGEFILQVEDNGAGFPDPKLSTDDGGASPTSGFGTSIIERLVAQFNGTVERGQSTLGGSRVTLTLRDLEYLGSGALEA